MSRPGTVLLDSARSTATHRRSLCFAQPTDILTAHHPSELPELLAALDDATASGAYVAGYLGYEAGYAAVDLDLPSQAEHSAMNDAAPAPLAWFGVYDRPTALAPADVAAGLSVLNGTASVADAELGVSREAYERALRTVKSHIREGDVYQINYTAPLRFTVHGDPRVLYRRLRAQQHVPYGAYLHTGPRQVLSFSPELFVRREGDRVITRPMKGTIRRGRTLEEDRELREQLAADPKNRAENLMIVDLLRNDLSVCCRPGSVQVPAMFETEPYDTVTQMTSTVEGRLQEDARLSDLLQATFPCGSVTGAPKRRAMQIIGDLEPSPRGVYCGAIGYAGPDDTAVFSVAIRTAVLDGHRGTMGIGSGVVWDSVAEAEYEECALKARFLTDAGGSPTSTVSAGHEAVDGSDGGEESPARPHRPQRTAPVDDDLKLIETMRFDGVRIPLLDRHLQRLERSAAYFGMPVDPDRVRRRLEALIRHSDLETLRLVRLTVDRWGRLDVTSRPIERSPDTTWELVVAEERVDPENRFLYHKTTRRDVYDRAAAEATAAGVDEAILLNDRGEVTEGARSNLFAKFDDRFVTPPTSCGLLAGVYRSYILDTLDRSEEGILTLDDLRRADALFCCNGVRGWVPAHLQPIEAGSQAA